jgi:serine/threonine-protein kinase RsbW
MTNAFRMTIGADLGEIAGVNAALAKFAEQHALPAPVRRSLQVALDELLSNTIGYGFAGQATVELEAAGDRVTLRLTDDGRPFDPFAMAAPDTSLPLEERRIGGLGIHLVRGLMDEVSYQRRGDSNVVVLTKLLSGGR